MGKEAGTYFVPYFVYKIKELSVTLSGRQKDLELLYEKI